MKKTVTIISILCVVIIAVGVLMLTGVIDVKELFGKSGLNVQTQTVPETGTETGDGQETSAARGDAVAWISYMDTCVLVDKNGIITGTNENKPEGLMELSGIDIKTMIIGEPVEVEDPESFEYGLLIANKLAAVGIPDTGEIFISADKSASVYLKNIKILLGKNEDVVEKLEALRKFYNKVIELEGTLDMQELDRNNMGYTFRLNGAETENISEDETEAETQEEEEYEEEYTEDYEEEYAEEYEEEYEGDYEEGE